MASQTNQEAMLKSILNSPKSSRPPPASRNTMNPVQYHKSQMLSSIDDPQCKFAKLII